MGARLRASAAVCAGALALHQLRYLAGHDDGAAAAVARQGHEYLGLAAPLVALLCALALAQLAVAWQRQLRPGRRLPLLRLWLAATVALLAIYTCQEALETTLSPGRSFVALATGSGWIAVPLGAALGFVVALLLRGADALLTARARRPVAYARPRNAPSPRPRTLRAPIGCIARHLASRAPPTPA